MVQIQTVIVVADNSDTKTLRCINILRCLHQRISGNVQFKLIVIATSIVRSRWNKKEGKVGIHHAVVIYSNNKQLRPDGGFWRIGETSTVLLTTDGLVPMGKCRFLCRLIGLGIWSSCHWHPFLHPLSWDVHRAWLQELVLHFLRLLISNHEGHLWEYIKTRILGISVTYSLRCALFH